MPVLMVSFLNGYLTPVGLFNTETQSYFPIRGVLDNVDDVRGIAKTNFGYILGVPDKDIRVAGFARSKIVLLDKEFKLINSFLSKNIVDVHSILYQDKIAYAISSGSDQVYSLGFSSAFDKLEETSYWSIRSSLDQENSPLKNTHHINSVGLQGKQLVVSMFGETKMNVLFNRKDGKVLECSSNKLLLEDLSHPHSIYIDGNDIILLESYLGNVLVNGERKLTIHDTYVRGLAVDKVNLYVGTSIRRTASKSKDGENLTYKVSDKCGIFIIDKKTFEIRKFFDLSNHGKEIYDLVLVA